MTCTAELCADRVSRALQSSYRYERNLAQRMSDRWAFTARAFQNWYYGRTSPSLHDLIKLMAECQALREEIDRLVEECRGNSA